MQKTNSGVKMAACLAALGLACASASAEIIYDNTTGYLGSYTTEANSVAGEAIGDSVIFGGTARTLTDIQFEYYATPGSAITATFNLYANGANGFPGTLIFTRDLGSITEGNAANGFGTAHISGLSLTVPDSVTYTVSFSGVNTGAGQSAGLLFYNGTTVGQNPTFDQSTQTIDATPNSSHPDFSVRHNSDASAPTLGAWTLLDHTPIDNFGTRFTAVPEPATWALLSGGLMLVALRRRRA